tara:strand:- start:97 stop:303 length:207 start_codon:yes stop_codon:yes gene_type:complete
MVRYHAIIQITGVITKDMEASESMENWVNSVEGLGFALVTTRETREVIKIPNVEITFVPVPEDVQHDN